MDSLKQCTLKGDIKTLQDLVNEDGQILDRVLEDWEETPLHIAARMGHVEFARLVLQLKPEFSAVKDQNGLYPLHVASAHGDAEIAREILRKVGENRMTMDVNSLCLLKDKDGKNPLHIAALRGSREVAEVILAANPSCLQDVTTQEETVLHLTVCNNRVELLKYFLGKKDIRSLVNRKDCHANWRRSREEIKNR
ncbi:ankyrin repeat-containing protein BDA1-like isoform X2 [Nymphaea colorata]|nr:ankyrin repeat-containing protein BDA1-like isoform X2 [Nymphaea colorata]XP_049932145.1 ankyrin repeat-containing protein BDA1-like isoform X2 [Nymphaea colorata]